jgi:ATP-dependent RNA helicase RhlE
MFDMGFLPSVRKIIATLPEKHQTLMFSATLPEEMEGLAAEFLKRALRVEIDASRPVETISHIVYPVTQADKNAVLSEILKDTATGQALIFVRTKYRAKKLAAHLSDGGLLAASLHGNLSQAQRDKAMQKFRSGNVRIMVATDIVARGIDISGISHVINFDMPDTSEAYTHRIGRTGRMMHRGAALTLATPEDRAMLKTIERLVGGKIERKVVVLPSNTVVAALDEGGEVRRARPAASQRTHDEHSRERPRDQHKTSPQPSGISVAASAVLPARHGTARGHGSSRKAMRHTRAGQSKAYISIP